MICASRRKKRVYIGLITLVLIIVLEKSYKLLILHFNSIEYHKSKAALLIKNVPTKQLMFHN